MASPTGFEPALPTGHPKENRGVARENDPKGKRESGPSCPARPRILTAQG
jgi:hypothetical protein